MTATRPDTDLPPQGAAPPRRRTAVVSPYFPPDKAGGGLYLERLFQQLADHGHEFTVYCTSRERLRDESHPENVAVRRMHFGRLWDFNLTRALVLHAYSVWVLARLLLDRGRFDGVLASDVGWSSIAAALAASWLRKPAWVRLSNVRGKAPRWLNRSLEGRWRLRLLRRLATMLLQTPLLVEDFAGSGFPPERLAVLPNGVDTRVFRPPTPEERTEARAVLGIPAGAPVVLFVGGLARRKGFHHLMASWEAVAAQVDQALLVLAGSPPEGHHHRKWVTKVNDWTSSHASSVRVAGHVDRATLVRYLHAADVFVLPSEAEGLPNALLEAMACARPCVIFPFVGYDPFMGRDDVELVVSGPTGEELSRDLVDLLQDPAKRERLAAAAHQLVSERFDLAQAVQAWDRVLAQER